MNGKVLDSLIVRLAEIECRKDTYEIVKETIGPIINSELKHLREIGVVYLFYNHDTNYYMTHVGYGCPLPGYILLKSCAIRLFMTGDLAFYSLCLGKVNMESKWCTWCDLVCKPFSTSGR